MPKIKWTKKDEEVIEKMYADGNTNTEIFEKIKEINEQINNIHQIEQKIYKMELSKKYDRNKIMSIKHIGEEYGMLKIVDYMGVDAKGANIFKCRCSCKEHNIVISTYTQLKMGRDNCGCLKAERRRESMGAKNTYDLSGEYGVGFTSNGDTFYFDKEDYDIISNYVWHKDKYGYMKTNLIVNGKRTLSLMHRMIAIENGYDENFVIDHINRVKTDNRKKNLRTCTIRENIINSSIRKNNSSGVVGVSWDKKRNKWSAQICVHRKNIHLGMFDTKDEAEDARKRAEKKYFGEFFDHESINNGKDR